MQHLHPTKAMQPQHKAPPDHGVKYAGGASCLLPRRGAPQLRQPRRVPAVAGSCPTQAASRPTRRRQAAVAGQPHAGPQAGLHAHSVFSSAVLLSSVQFLVFKAKSQDF